MNKGKRGRRRSPMAGATEVGLGLHRTGAELSLAVFPLQVERYLTIDEGVEVVAPGVQVLRRPL